MRYRLFLCGLAIWLVATLALRLAGQHVLHPRNWKSTLIIFAAVFPFIAWMVPRLCRRFGLPLDQWPAGAFWLLLPTLLLDPFSSAFFPVVFPNMVPEVAGLFGGLMLWCCAGALVGVHISGHEQA
ncbi:MAG: DUF5367 family protein [Candidatus Acidiferrales bacterium]